MSRPTCSVFNYENPTEVVSTVPVPSVFESPIRYDVCETVHDQMKRNRMQARGVKYEAGYGTAAESWGTGRAVSRIPRVPGGGTHRAGQAAFGNMCRGGGMFAPLKTWRRFQRRINIRQRRFAVCSALAASTVPALCTARGHNIDSVSELPIVLSRGAETNISKTKDLVSILEKVGLGADLERVAASHSIRAGRGKIRNRRYVSRKGPLIITAGPVKTRNGSSSEKAIVTLPIARAAQNIRGVDVANVERLNILQLAPGGKIGRVIVWTVEALEALDNIWSNKSKFNLPRATMTSADVGRIINSDEVQSKINPLISHSTCESERFHSLRFGSKIDLMKCADSRKIVDPCFDVEKEAKRIADMAAFDEKFEKEDFKSRHAKAMSLADF